MNKLRSFGPAFIILAAFLWSLDGLLRRSLYVLPPMVVVTYEHLIGFILLLPLLIPHIAKIKKIKQKAWGAFAWITLLSSILGTYFYTAALGKIQFIQFSVVVLLQQLQPLFVVFFAWLLLKEHVKKIFVLYVAIALSGAYMVSFPDLKVNLETGQGTAIAAAFAVLAAFCWGSSTAFSRYVLLQLPTVVATGLRFGLAAVLGFFFVFVFNQQEALTSLSQTQWLTLGAIALSTGMVALFIYYYGLKRTPASVSAICELTWPLSAVIIDFVFFQKTLSTTQTIGALLLLFAIYKVSLMSKKIVITPQRPE
ncbi:MAG: DMT family transporter [Candidatus Levybacteria bacterium]|nr:DMT family transporter [Candidatus Levybacteria bacterium]